MRLAVLVTNAAGLMVIDTIHEVPDGAVQIGDDIFAGFIRNEDGSFSPPPIEEVPEFVPPLTRVQFFTGAAIAGIISQDDALLAVNGGMPQPFKDFVASLPEAQRFPATMLLSGTMIFERGNPLVNAFASFKGMTADHVDTLWKQWLTL